MSYEDWQFHDTGDPNGIIGFLETLIELEAIEGVALGVTKQFIDLGYDSLTPKQKNVFDRYVIDEFTSKSCERCSSEIPWSEMYEAYENGGFCGYCIHVMSKND